MPRKRLIQGIVNFTLPGLRSHTLRTRVFSLPRPFTPCTPSSSPGLARSLARSSPGLARPSPGPRPASPAPRPPWSQAILPSKRAKEKFTTRELREIHYVSDFSTRPWRNLPPTWVIHMATRRPAPQHADPHRFLVCSSLKRHQVHVDRRVCGLVCGLPRGSPMWGANFAMAW